MSAKCQEDPDQEETSKEVEIENDEKVLEEKEIDKNLKCPRCQKVYKHPKLLSCMHTLCLSCAKEPEIIQQQQKLPEAPTIPPVIKCPTCQQETKVRINYPFVII